MGQPGRARTDHLPITATLMEIDNLKMKFNTFNTKFDLFIDKHNQLLEKILEKLTGTGNHMATNSKNVELDKLIKSRVQKGLGIDPASDAPPSETQSTRLDGSEKPKNDLQNCFDCGAKPGEPHSDNCDTERCSVCGGQKLQCECVGHDKLFARWTGIWPGEAESEYLGIDLNSLQKYRTVFFVKPLPKVNRPFDAVLKEMFPKEKI
jgi:hypothetical protein